MEKIKVLHLSENDIDGSINRVNLQYPKGFGDIPRYGIELGTLARDAAGWMTVEGGKTGLRIHVVNMTGPLDLRAAKSLAELARRENFSIIHSHGYRANITARLAKRFFGADVKLVNSVRGMPARQTARIRLYTAVDCATMTQSAKTIAVSAETREKLIARGVPAPQIVVIHNALDLDRFDPDTDCGGLREKFGFAESDIVVGYLGRLAEKKGLEYLLQAAKILSEKKARAKFLLVGEGPLRPALERIVSDAGIAAHVVFAGYQADIQPHYALMDIVVLPSFSEGMPVSLIEAMAMKRPVVASSLGCIAEMVDHGVNGLLVPPGDANGLAAAIEKLVSDPPLRKSMGEAALAIARERFSLDKMCARMAAVYDSIIG